MKTSLGIWAFGPMVTRFVPVGYQPQHGYDPEPVAEKVHRAVEGLGDLIDGYEGAETLGEVVHFDSAHTFWFPQMAYRCGQ